MTKTSCGDPELVRVLLARIEAQSKIAASQGDSSTAMVAWGKIQEYAQDTAGALASYSRAAERDPNCFEARARLAICYAKSRETDQALHAAMSLSKDAPTFVFEDLGGNRVSVMSVLGDALRMSGLRSAAVDAYVRAVELEPGPCYAAGYLADLRVEMGQLSDAATLVDRIKPLPRFAGLIALLRLAGNDASKLPVVEAMSRTGRTHVLDVAI